jgi:predicted permease
MEWESDMVPQRTLGGLTTAFQHAVSSLRAGGTTIWLAFIILTLTMAGGTVTFSVIDATALRPLPFAAPHRLVDLSQPGPMAGRTVPVSPQQYFTWAEQATAFESVGAARFIPPLQLAADGVTESLIAKAVTANLFDVLGVRPFMGRTFSPEHERPGGPPVVVLSHELWVRRFRADPAIVGRQLTFADGSREVLGVLPRAVWYPITAGDPPDVYVPYVATAADRFNSRGFSMSVVARLRQGLSLEQARADIQRLSAGVVRTLDEQVLGPQRASLLLILAAIAVVLLVACLNVAILLLARIVTRQREFAIRESLGASRPHLALGVLLEALILSFTAATAAVVLSFWGVGIAKANLPSGLSRVSTIAVDGRVLIVSALTAVCCAMVFGTAPAWRAGRADLVTGMKSAGAGTLGGGGRQRALAGFLVANVSFVYLLLVATTLVVTSFVLITTADLGFDRRQVAVLSYQRTLSGAASQTRGAADTLRAELMQRVKTVPGITHAAIVVNGGTPLSGSHVKYGLTIPGFGEVRGDDALETRTVTPEYFEAMGMSLISGRFFQPSDRAGAPLVMLINDVAARRFFRGQDPVGKVVTFRGPTTIVGVLRGVRFEGPEVDVPPEMYTPADQEKPLQPNLAFGFLVVRSSSDIRRVASAARAAIRPAITGEPGEPQFVEDHFRRLTASRRFNAQLMFTFGLMAFVIGGIGVFGTMAFVVAQQVPAIGLRMTLGATPQAILASVLATALRRIVVGVALGFFAAWKLAGAATAFVFEIRPTEPLVFIAVAGFLTIVGVAAALVPALRAARVDPLVTIRQE